jgi:MFS transporter, FSR family, fosmidomycin resistance protein
LDDGKKSLASTSVAHFVNDGTNGFIPLMYPVYNDIYGISIQTVPVFAALQNVFSIVVSPYVGKRADSTGKFAWLMTFGVLLLAFGTAGYALSVLFLGGFPLIVVLIVFSIVIGVGSSFYHPIGPTLMSEKLDSSKLSRAMGVNGSIGSFGRFVMPFLATFMITYAKLPSLSILAAGAALGGIVAFFILNGVEFEKTSRIMGSQESTWKSVLPDWKLARPLFPLTVVSFSRGICTGVLPLVPFYLVNVDHFGSLEAGFIYTLALGAGIAAQILFGFMQERFGHRFALGFSNLGAVGSLFAFVLSPNAIFVDISVVLFGLFTFGAFPLLVGMVRERSYLYPGAIASANSMVWGIGNSSGGAVAPLLVGAFALPTVFGSLVPGFMAAAAVGVVAVVVMPLT